MQLDNQTLTVLQDRLKDRLKHLDIAPSRASTESGLNHTFVKSILAGTAPNVVNLARLAGFLGVSISYLVGETDEIEGAETARAASMPVYAQVSSALQDLEAIDRMSVRALREIMLDTPGARERLERLEQQAAIIRRRLPKEASYAA